ncbi:protein RKD1-like [Dioscorea cayenensis subsp. rotundata]|uniref:Protein RKD1-like n=1 Tax=Dioscorea cayennensis subsp. rotundata TaxID=55577 RepID=A0AB40AKJ8_DIOCR|nr:protein RKD1-like [Dioscorea cayenensis subsp. rotundata]
MEMDNNNYEIAATMADDQLDFSEFPLWNWQLDYPIDDFIVEASPLAQCDSSCSFFPPDNLIMQDEFYGLLDGENGFWDENLDNETSSESKKVERSVKDEKVITFEDVSRYFYMPITQAAKELNVGLTLLKKKCRELGIPRWPHRKMKSLQTLIKNVQELGREEGNVGEEQLRSALDILEQEKKMMEKEPGLQLEEKTKRLRQACFKANYKKRRLMALEYTNHL